MNERLLFFILAPIIFKGIIFSIISLCNYWKKNKRENKFILLTSLLVDYITEFFYLKTVKDILGVWIFDSDFVNIESYDVYKVFVIFSIIANILLCVIVLFDETILKTPMSSIIVLFFIFICFNTGHSIILRSRIFDTEQDIFYSMEYQMQENTFCLQTMKDGNNILIADNYLHYSYIDDSGKMIMEKIWNNGNVNIYEDRENSIPRVVYKKYYKSYKTKNNSFYNAYYVYDFYVSSTIDCINFDIN